MTSAVIVLLMMLAPVSALADDSTGMDFTADIRLFAAYAFMNAAGNNDEWRKEGMHPMRVAVRQELAERCDPALLMRMSAFNDSHGGSWTLYGDYALLTSGPPDFRLSYDPSSTPDGKGLEE